MVTEKQGDIFADSKNWDAFIHGCNCFTTMGGGIARIVKQEFPEAYKTDLKTLSGDRSKVGTFTSVHTKNKWIINAYTQYHFAAKGQDVFEYEGFRKILKSVVTIIKSNYKTDYTLAMPKIGAGLAGGNWDDIYDIIVEECKDINVIIYSL
ncbi:MAG: macro domain-containing protein [Romboutsia sp.]